MRGSKMLELVRQWRADAFELMRMQKQAERAKQAHEWAEGLGLTILGDNGEASLRKIKSHDGREDTPCSHPYKGTQQEKLQNSFTI